MSVNVYDSSTGQLKPLVGTKSHLEDEMFAYYEPTSTVTHAYAAGEQFIYDDALCTATTAIAIGDTLVQGTNYTLSDSITKQIKDVADRPLWNPKGTCVFANLPSIANSEPGDMWNVSDEFTTTSDFREGAGIVVPAGANIYLTSDSKWDVMTGSAVVGVKGAAESSYRKGNVNITPANIGINEMIPATASTDGTGGTIPAPLAGDENKALFGDGTYKSVDAASVSEIIAPTESTSTAAQSHPTGSQFIYNDILYTATSNIAVGGTITPGTNCTPSDTIVEQIEDSLSIMTGATSSANGTSGRVPAPTAGQQNNYLRGDGTWADLQIAEYSASDESIVFREDVAEYDSLDEAITLNI